ncbi:hypothetical protein GCM10027590_07880 [Nocardiopsis nanhaiensis]
MNRENVEKGHPLSGGMMNTVVRRGDRVVRNAPNHAPALQGFLAALTAAGFDGAPRPLALHADGREELTFVEGDVAVPPFPEWALEDRVVTESARLMRRYHDVAARVRFDPGTHWPAALSDPEGGPLLCHNDPCLENLVFRNGAAVALIDFDLAAPGRPLWDVAALAFYMGPTLDPESAAGTVFAGLDASRRLRLMADAYGLSHHDRLALPETVQQYNEVSREFVRGMVEDGNPLFVRDFERLGGWARWDRRRDWLIEQRPVFVEALTA